MLKDLRDLFDIKTFVVSVTISFTWIIITDFIANNYFSPNEAAIIQRYKGLTFVFFISIVLSVLHGREKKVLRNKRDDFDRLFRSSPTPTLLISTDENRIHEANQKVLSTLTHTHDSIQKLKLNEIFYDFEEWQHILRDIRESQKGKATTHATLVDRYKNLVPVYLSISLFRFNNHYDFLIFIDKSTPKNKKGED